MGGNWNPDSINPRPGAYINFESSGSTPVAPGEFGRIGMPIRAEWGPANTFVDIATDAERIAAYGDTDGDVTSTLDTSWLIREAIIGGAELVKAYRLVDTGSAAAASVTVTDALGQNTLDIMAKYVGLRSNNFSITVGPSILSGRSVLSVVETIGTGSPTVVESFVYTNDSLAALVADINANSNFIVAAFSAGADPETSEVVTLTAAALLTAGDFRLVLNFGDGQAAQTTVDIDFDGSLVANVQAAINTALVAGGYIVGDLTVALVTGTDGMDLAAAPTVYSVTASGGLANQNISIGVIDGGLLAPVGGVVASSASSVELTTGAALTAGAFRLNLNIDNGGPAITTADILFSASNAAVQTAIDTALAGAPGGYTAGDVTFTNTAGGPTLDAAAGTWLFSTSVAFAARNISVTASDGTIPVPGALVPALPGAMVFAAGLAQGGGRSQLLNGSVTMSGAASSAAPTFADYFGDMVTTGITTLFEAEGGFDLFAFDGVSEEDFVGFNAAVKTWAHTNNDAGRYMFVVIGGGATELATADTATALNRTALFDAIDPGLPSHPEFIANIGVSGLEIVSPRGNTLLLTSAQSAPRVAGLIAKQGIIGSITFSDTGAVAVNGSLTPIQIEALIQQGLLIFSKRGNFVRIEDGVTAFISETEEKDFTFTQIRAARAIQQIGLDVSEIVETDWIGQRINTQSVRDSLVAVLQGYFAQLEAQQVLVNGTQVQIDTRYDNTRTNVFILVLAKFQFELKRVLLTIRVPTVS